MSAEVWKFMAMLIFLAVILVASYWFRQAESERDRRAKVISAEGEFQASERLREAADRLESPQALQIRLFQTMNEIANEQNSTIILPVPIDLFRPFLDSQNGPAKPRQARREEEEPESAYEEAVGYEPGGENASGE